MAKPVAWDKINLEEEYWYQGDPILFTNPQIRRMLSLARIGPNDVFYDLGCGFGQNLIVAMKEFNVRKAVGIESDRERAWRANERLRELGLQTHGKALVGDFRDLLSTARIKEASAIFYGLQSEVEILNKISRVWHRCKPGRKLIYYERHLIPEIMPTVADPPFFVSESHFKAPSSEKEWLSKVVLLPGQFFKKKRKAAHRNLWAELTINQDILGVRGNVEDYRERLKHAVKTARARRSRASV